MSTVTLGAQTDRKFAHMAILGLAVLMFAILGWGVQLSLNNLVTGSPVRYLPIMLAVIALEAILTYHRSLALEGGEKVLFRVSEWVTIFLILKLFLVLAREGNNLGTELQNWQQDFIEAFFDPNFIGHLVLIVLAWTSANFLAGKVDEMLNRAEDTGWEDAGKLSNSLKQIRQQFIAVLIVMLVLLLGLTALTHATQNIADLLSLTPASNSPIWPVMAFAVLLLVQFSLTQFVLLRSRWEIDRAEVTRSVRRSWLVYGLIFLAAIGLFAAILPTRYSISFFDMVRAVVSFFYVVFGAILAAIMSPILWLMSLFGPQDTNSPAESVVPPVLASPTPAPAAEPLAWWETARVMLFWVVFVGVVGFALFQILFINRSLWQSIARFPLFRRLAELLSGLAAWLKRSAQAIREQVARMQIAQNLPRITLPTSRRAPAGPLTARERLIQLYRELLQQAGERGLGRRPYQTPYQYEQRLQERLPDVHGEVSDVTAGFVEARYSLHPVAEEDADAIEGEIKRVISALDRQQ